MKFLLLLLTCSLPVLSKDTFTPLKEGDSVPQNVTDLWKDYDPRAEPIEKEIVTTYEKDGIICEYVLYTVATIKGTPSRIAAFYTYPKGGKNLPAFVWAHGGGQRAENKRGFHFAKKGFATIDINWNGRELDPEVEKNTDWGKVDPTQGKRFYAKAPREKRNTGMEPDEYMIDEVVSPRNKYWFLLTVAGRRAITFLEQQEQVDPERIGFTGFSMGGNITSYCAIDPRLKAVVPVVGGEGHHYTEILGYPKRNRKLAHAELELNTINSLAYWPLVTAPVMFISGTNDFHGRQDFLQDCADRLPKDTPSRTSQTLHNNHGPVAAQFLALEYWFDHYLKGDPKAVPVTPASSLKKVTDQESLFTVTPADPGDLKAVNIYFSWDTAMSNRFNKPVSAVEKDGSWQATIPAHPDLPLTVFADVRYHTHSKNAEEAFGREADDFSITSRFHRVIPENISEETFTKNAPKGSFEPIFAEFPKDNLIWSTGRDGSVMTYKFNDNTLEFPADKKLTFHVNPEKAPLDLLVSFSSQKHLIRERNQVEGSINISHRFAESGVFSISLADLVKKAEDEKTGEDSEQRITDWRNVSTMKVRLREAKSRKVIPLLDKEIGKKFLPRIEWAD